MRIVAGEWRGRKLAAPKGDSTRPTADRARETLFAMLTSRLGNFEGLQVADLFAGSGALGLEALSRGAEHCLFVEQDRAAVDVIRTNITTLGAQARTRVEAGSVMGGNRNGFQGRCCHQRPDAGSGTPGRQGQAQPDETFACGYRPGSP